MPAIIGLQLKVAAAPHATAGLGEQGLRRCFPPNSDTGRNPVCGDSRPMAFSETASPVAFSVAVPLGEGIKKTVASEFCRCSIDVVGGKLVASTISSAFDTTQVSESGQTNGATGC